ncbi:polysaccharide deacetylase family protein [uncultured Enterovirga sp.]|uniref:polysaccharide deacetylase family protein n=1 Tax=uncultured Enterovirga sp. TaxID=2026352 RepID=UPI0035CC78F9
MPALPLSCVLTVNVEVESHDALVAGGAGLFGRYSYGRYGAREGVWRLLDTFAALQVPATFFVDADDALSHPHIIEAILAGSHEVAQLGPPDLEAETDRSRLRDRLATSRDALARIAGRPVAGWRAPAGIMTEPTLPILAELGFLYDSSFQDDDAPYLFGEEDGPTLMEVPTFKYLSDMAFYTARRNDETVRTAWGEEFAAIYAEGTGYAALTVNARGDFGSGRALRTRLVGEWIGRAKQYAGVTITRCDHLAEQRRASLRAEPFPRLESFAQDAA